MICERFLLLWVLSLCFLRGVLRGTGFHSGGAQLVYVRLLLLAFSVMWENLRPDPVPVFCQHWLSGLGFYPL